MPAGMLAWDAAAPPRPLLQAQLRQLAEGPLLRALVQQQLPSVIPEGPTVPTGEVYSLCRLLHGLLEMQALQAQVLITLAVAADLVPRLWFSCLRVRLACSGSGVMFREYAFLVGSISQCRPVTCFQGQHNAMAPDVLLARSCDFAPTGFVC